MSLVEHFPPKWVPVRRRKCDQPKESRACSDSIGSKHALGPAPRRHLPGLLATAVAVLAATAGAIMALVLNS